MGPRFPRGPAEPGHDPDELSPRRASRPTSACFLPEPVVEALLTGLPLMDRRFGGRFLRDATLTGPESRGSSPVRIVRDPRSRQSPGGRRALPLRRRGRLRRRDRQRGRRRAADGAGDRGDVREPVISLFRKPAFLSVGAHVA